VVCRYTGAAAIPQSLSESTRRSDVIVTLIRSSEPARRNPLDRDRLAGIQLPPPIIMINFLCVSATLVLSCRVASAVPCRVFSSSVLFLAPLLQLPAGLFLLRPTNPNFDTLPPPNQIPPRLEYRLSFAHGKLELSELKSWRFVICSSWFVFFRAHQLVPVMRAYSQKRTRGTRGRKGGRILYLSYLCAFPFLHRPVAR
jgi:hypothetical protein